MKYGLKSKNLCVVKFTTSTNEFSGKKGVALSPCPQTYYYTIHIHTVYGGKEGVGGSWGAVLRHSVCHSVDSDVEPEYINCLFSVNPNPRLNHPAEERGLKQSHYAADSLRWLTFKTQIFSDCHFFNHTYYSYKSSCVPPV